MSIQTTRLESYSFFYSLLSSVYFSYFSVVVFFSLFFSFRLLAHRSYCKFWAGDNNKFLYIILYIKIYVIIGWWVEKKCQLYQCSGRRACINENIQYTTTAHSLVSLDLVIPVKQPNNNSSHSSKECEWQQLNWSPPEELKTKRPEIWFVRFQCAFCRPKRRIVQIYTLFWLHVHHCLPDLYSVFGCF